MRNARFSILGVQKLSSKEINSSAFIGLGQLGRAIAGSLVQQLPDLVGIDINEESRLLAKAEGINYNVASLDELTRPLDAIFLCLPGPCEVLETVSHLKNYAYLEEDCLLIDFSTIGPAATKELEILVSTISSLSYVACPVSGGVLRTRRHESTVLCGSQRKEKVEQVLPLLHHVFNKVIVFSSPWYTSIAKLTNNIAAISNALGTIESIGFGLRSGLTMKEIFDVMEAGTASSYVVESTLKRSILERDESIGFAMHLALKDLYLALDHAEKLNYETSFLNASIRYLKNGVDRGYGDSVFPIAHIANKTFSSEEYKKT